MIPKSHVYFMTNKNNSVIYIGVTSNLKQRIHQHKTKVFAGFSSKYNCDKLVYFEEYENINEAIIREKQLKSGNRTRKEKLVVLNNSSWEDLAKDWVFHF